MRNFKHRIHSAWCRILGFLHRTSTCACGRPLQQGWDCPACRRSCITCGRALLKDEDCERCLRKNESPLPPFPPSQLHQQQYYYYQQLQQHYSMQPPLQSIPQPDTPCASPSR